VNDTQTLYSSDSVEFLLLRVSDIADCECWSMIDLKKLKPRRLWVTFGVDFDQYRRRNMDVV
jgi:hypothetical protein